MTITAVYELKRQGILLGYLQSPENFDAAYVYAVDKRIPPIFHEGIMREAHGHDPFAECYVVTPTFAQSVISFVDECWMNKDFSKVGFYDLESMFGGHHEIRMELIHILEYARIAGRFDDELFEAVEANSPTEAHPLGSSFCAADIHFD